MEATNPSLIGVGLLELFSLFCNKGTGQCGSRNLAFAVETVTCFADPLFFKGFKASNTVYVL